MNKMRDNRESEITLIKENKDSEKKYNKNTINK